ncbi:kinase-like protein [Aaosphaeria arxii CBS 175.79]|uniref:Kinase-like protein n=1 Tax=Aaosphaeria arxii CBS 175.79 TaxID=1450172 RepID=A0A6A5XKR4_9PLEO|nr:kinase-like protein [Aaosphaeria arxii CBS 175.79]KAF2013441.1 kinase-like protein [Aaosphaeria arxii CBS 175.79]
MDSQGVSEASSFESMVFQEGSETSNFDNTVDYEEDPEAEGHCFSADVESEYFHHYGPGLFHPVYIGDIYKDGRYKIEQKLGWGSSSTVWGARDLHDDKFVAIKVIESKASENDKELRILQHLRDSDLEHPGRKHIIKLLDHFYHDGVNGRHLCIVTEAAGQTLYQYVDAKDRGLPGRLDGSECRLFSRQLLLAVDFMHKCNILHGELHNSNIMFLLPDYCYYDEPCISQVTRKDGEPIGEHMPKHVVGKPRISTDHDKKKNMTFEMTVKVVDFSMSFFADELPTHVATNRSMRPPEMIIERPVSKAMDIWQLACVTYWAATRSDLFDVTYDTRTLIPQIHKVIGESSADWLLSAMIEGTKNELWKDVPPPYDFNVQQHILEKTLRLRVYHPDKNRDFWWKMTECDMKMDAEDGELSERVEKIYSERLKQQKEAAALYKPLEGRPEVARYIVMLGRYLRRMLVVDPDQRPSAEELLTEAFVQDLRLDDYVLSNLRA